MYFSSNAMSITTMSLLVKGKLIFGAMTVPRTSGKRRLPLAVPFTGIISSRPSGRREPV